jgi:hypothetical protein
VTALAWPSPSSPLGWQKLQRDGALEISARELACLALTGALRISRHLRLGRTSAAEHRF